MDVPINSESIINPRVANAQQQLLDQFRRADRKAFAKKALIGSAIWFAAVGLLATGMKMQQVIDAQSLTQ